MECKPTGTIKTPASKLCWELPPRKLSDRELCWRQEIEMERKMRVGILRGGHMPEIVCWQRQEMLFSLWTRGDAARCPACQAGDPLATRACRPLRCAGDGCAGRCPPPTPAAAIGCRAGGSRPPGFGRPTRAGAARGWGTGPTCTLRSSQGVPLCWTAL